MSQQVFGIIFVCLILIAVSSVCGFLAIYDIADELMRIREILEIKMDKDCK